MDSPITWKAAHVITMETQVIRNQDQLKTAALPHSTAGCTPAAFCNSLAPDVRSCEKISIVALRFYRMHWQAAMQHMTKYDGLNDGVVSEQVIFWLGVKIKHMLNWHPTWGAKV